MDEGQAKLVITAENRTQIAFNAIKRNMDEVQSSAGRLTAALGAIGVGLSVGGIAAAFAGIVKYRDSLNDLADLTGDSIQNLDGVARAARLSGVGVEELSGLFGKLSKSLGDSGEDGKAAGAALRAIGLDVQALRSLRPNEAFLEVARALDQYADGADKVRVAQALLGKEGAKSLPLLKDLAEIGVQQGRVTAEQAAEAEKLDKAFKGLALALEDSKQGLATALIPEIAKLVTEMRVGIEIAGSFGEALRLFGVGINPARALGENIQAELQKLDDIKRQRTQVYAFLRQDTLDAAEADATKRLAFLRRQEQEAALRLSSAANFDARDLRARQKPLLDFKGAPDAAKEAKLSEFDQLRQSLEQELARAGAAGSKEEELRLALATDKYKQLTAAQREQIVELGRLIDTRKVDQLVAELNAKDEKKSIEEQIALLKKKNDELRASADEFAVLADPTIPIQQRLARLGEVQKSDRALDPEQADIAYFKLQQELLRVQTGVQGVNEELERGDDIARDLGLTFTSAFEDAIAGGKGLSEVLKGLAADVGKIITRKTITEPLGEGISGLIKDSGVGKGIGSFFKDLFRADGGPVSAGSPYIVGERGPELFVPGASGHIVPNGGFGGDTYVIDARGADAGGLARLESMIRSLNGSIERRSVAAVFNAQMRGVRV